jgi:hypothetical protein
MRSKEAFAYSRSTGYFCSVAAVHPAPHRRVTPRRAGACHDATGVERHDQLINAALAAWFGSLTRVVPSFNSMISSHLAQANRYIAEMRADIALERVFLEHALDAGYPSEVAESMLHALEAALRIFEKHRELVLDQLKRRPSE